MLHKFSSVINRKKELSTSSQSSLAFPTFPPQHEFKYLQLDEFCKESYSFYYINQHLAKNLKNNMNINYETKNDTKLISDDVLTYQNVIDVNKKWYNNLKNILLFLIILVLIYLKIKNQKLLLYHKF